MFGYQRNIWNADTLKALLSRVPDDKMLLLDLAADYNKTFWRNGMNWDVFKGFSINRGFTAWFPTWAANAP